MALCVALLALLAGCGSRGQEPQKVPDSLGYIPGDAFYVALVPTDLGYDQWRRFDKLASPALAGSEFDTVRKNIAASIPDVNFEEEVEPLLDDTPVVQFEGGKHELDAAVDRHEAGSGMDPETFTKEFGDGAEDDALVRLLQRGPCLQPVGPVNSAALAFRLDSDAISLHVRAHTDDPQRLVRLLEALGERGVHELPGIGASIGVVGDGFVLEDGDGRSTVKLVPLGEPTSHVETSGDEVDAEVTTPVPGGL